MISPTKAVSTISDNEDDYLKHMLFNDGYEKVRGWIFTNMSFSI